MSVKHNVLDMLNQKSIATFYTRIKIQIKLHLQLYRKYLQIITKIFFSYNANKEKNNKLFLVFDCKYDFQYIAIHIVKKKKNTSINTRKICFSCYNKNKFEIEATCFRQ